MLRALLVLGSAALAAAAAAQSSAVTLLMPNVDPQPLVGSIVNVDKAATTYAVGCAPHVDSESCGLPESQTVTQGPSTWALTYSFKGSQNTYLQDANCKLDWTKDVGTCTISVSQHYDGTTTEQSTTVVNSGFKTVMVTVTITAGLDKIEDASAGATGTATTAPATASAATTTNAKAPTGTTKTSTAADTPATTTTSNAAFPMITQNAVLAGMAAIVGGAMAL